MKKVVLCLLVAVAVTGVVCEENPLLESAKAFGEFAGAAAAYALHSDSIDEFTENMAEHEFSSEYLQDAEAFGEFAGAAAAYALHSDSVDEFTENMAEHEYKSENLQEAQEDTSEIIDAVTDAYIDLTSDDEEE